MTTTQFPIEDCYTCTHNEVCKHIDAFQKLRQKSTVPVKWQEVACLHYTDEVVEEDMFPNQMGLADYVTYTSNDDPDEYEYDDDDTYKAICYCLDKIYESAGRIPSVILMSKRTAEDIIIANMFSRTKPIDEKLESIITPYGDLSIHISDSLELGSFIIGDWEDDYEEE